MPEGDATPKGATPKAGAGGAEEEAEENVAKFFFRVGPVTNLPGDLETVVALGGICDEKVQSHPAPASANPASWDFDSDVFIRPNDAVLHDALVSSKLSFKLLDQAADLAEIGAFELDLKSLLHDATEVAGEFELILTETYGAMWDVEPDPGADPDVPPPPKPERKPTMVTFSVSVENCIGPDENSKDWTALTFAIDGVYGLPEKLGSLGVAGDDVENHQFTYKAWFWGEQFPEGALNKAAEKREADADAEEPKEPGAPEWRADQERFSNSVGFKTASRTVYRGKEFINQFRSMLNNLGGVWLHIIPEVKEPADPKKLPAGWKDATEAAAIAKQFTGRCWVNLLDFLTPGTSSISVPCELKSTHPDETQETSFEISKTFVNVRTELLKALVPLQKAEEEINPIHMIPPRQGLQKFPSSNDAALMYVETLEKCLETLHSEYSRSPGQEVPHIVEHLKLTGSFKDMKADIRSVVIRVFREKLKKNPNIIPNKIPPPEQRDEFFSDVYVYLKDTMGEVLNESLKRTKEGSAKVQVAERSEAQKAKAKLREVSDMGKRCSGLVYEAEMVGNWDRAAKFFQSFLVLEENQKEPKAWLDYAQFLMRAGQRQGAAEEALQQALMVMSNAPGHEDTLKEVQLMIACLLLDRERHEDSISLLQQWHAKDMTDPTVNFFLALARFLNGEADVAGNLMQLVTKPRDWFKGLPDDNRAFDKLRLFASAPSTEDGGQAAVAEVDPAPYLVCLNKLVSYGLPKLIFTFLDQVQALPAWTIASEPFVLIEAKSLVLERDYEGAAAALERLMKETESLSQESWRLLGECYFQMKDYDQALQALNQALSFEETFDDPVVYIRLGHVLSLKERWKQARDAFLKSIRCRPTAEAWGGIAFAEYRSEHNHLCYEALCEANLLDNERSDIWAQLTLLHLRFKNWQLADHCFRHCLLNNPASDEWLLEIGIEYLRHKRSPTVAEAAARRALKIRDTGCAHEVLADALARQEFCEKAILELQVAIRLLYDQPEIRKGIFEKALQLCKDLDDPPLAESIHIAQKLADQRLQEQNNATQRTN